MSDDKSVPGSKSYKIGNVGAGARVAQGENISWVESPSSAPEMQELFKQFNALLEKIATDPNMDDDTKAVTVEKTKAVANSLAKAQEEPNKLKIALMDAKGWLTTTAGWAWDGLNTILKSETAQKAIAGIGEAGVKAAIGALLGVI
ncbi:MAG TPA: hypothetical protein VK206_24765 [Anaerolineales bacterium]|nr:hypothetical protein [Anaerolineales bacterium]HLO28634.1 hypothetical protein [Anaerolineales bacterium]